MLAVVKPARGALVRKLRHHGFRVVREGSVAVLCHAPLNFSNYAFHFNMDANYWFEKYKCTMCTKRQTIELLMYGYVKEWIHLNKTDFKAKPVWLDILVGYKHQGFVLQESNPI